jgi:hypothetical protein
MVAFAAALCAWLGAATARAESFAVRCDARGATAFSRGSVAPAASVVVPTPPAADAAATSDTWAGECDARAASSIAPEPVRTLPTDEGIEEGRAPAPVAERAHGAPNEIQSHGEEALPLVMVQVPPSSVGDMLQQPPVDASTPRGVRWRVERPPR